MASDKPSDGGEAQPSSVDGSFNAPTDNPDARTASREVANETATESLVNQFPPAESTQVNEQVVGMLTQVIAEFVERDISTKRTLSDRAAGKSLLTTSADVNREFVITSPRDDVFPFNTMPYTEWINTERTMSDITAGRLLLTLRDLSGNRHAVVYPPDQYEEFFQEAAAYCVTAFNFRYTRTDLSGLPSVIETQNLLLVADLRVTPPWFADRLATLGSLTRDELSVGNLTITFRQERIPTVEQLLHLASELRSSTSTSTDRNDRPIQYEPALTGRMIIDPTRPIHVTAIWNSKPSKPERVFYSADWATQWQTAQWEMPDWSGATMFSRYEVFIDRALRIKDLGVLANLLDGSSTIDNVIASMRYTSEAVYDCDNIEYLLKYEPPGGQAWWQ